MSLAVLAGIFGLITTIFWLVIGWRAMKAHEDIAESVSLLRREVSKFRDNLASEEKERNGLPKIND